MSQLRTPMIWGGGATACAGLVALILRLIGAHGRLPYLAELPPLHYYGAAAGAAVLGLILIFAAPADRQAQRRVKLEERPVQEGTTLRPARHHGIPTTSGFAPTKPQAPSTHAPAAAPRTNGNGGAAATSQKVVSETPAKAAWGRPRAEEAPAMVPGSGPSPNAQAAGRPRAHPNEAHSEPAHRAPILSPDAEEAYTRQRARREQLHERLEALEQKANQAKVRFGLGKVSAAGYRQYLAEVDQERMMIESELMEGEE